MKPIRVIAVLFSSLIVLGACPPPEEAPTHEGNPQCIQWDDNGDRVRGGACHDVAA